MRVICRRPSPPRHQRSNLVSATAATLTKLLAWRPGGYLRASGVLLGWLALRTLAQTALFVLVARSMGADGYGALIAVMALAGVFSFAGMGQVPA